MNVNTGATYLLDKTLGQATYPGDAITHELLADVAPPAPRETELRDAVRQALDRKEHLVAVDAAVAQKLRLGERELARRHRRR